MELEDRDDEMFYDCKIVYREQDSIGQYQSGTIYLSPVLKECTPEIVKFVIGHEYGHHICRRLKMFESKYKIMAIIKRRQEEYWCDRYAHNHHSNTGGIMMFRRLMNDHPIHKILDWFQWSHPPMTRRLKKLEALPPLPILSAL
jgi:Zn-dependent protease with chaperone function